MNEAYQRQAEIRAKCFHPTGQWEEFRPQDLEQSVVSRFEQMAVRYPDRLAVQFGNDKLTYAELNMQANQLARAILKQCGQDSSPILFLLDQGVAAMVVLLGILKAGKCYVALDPEFPIARLAAIWAACQSTLLVTNQKHEVLAQQLMSYQPFG